MLAGADATGARALRCLGRLQLLQERPALHMLLQQTIHLRQVCRKHLSTGKRFCSRPCPCCQVLSAQQALLQEALQPENHSCHSLNAITCKLLQQKLAYASKHLPHNHLSTASIKAKRSKLGITHLVGALVAFQAGLEPRCRSLRLPNVLQARPVSMPRTFYA